MKAEIAVLVLFTLLFACLALSLVAAAQPCLTGADQEPCDGSVTLAELMDYVGEWYACSSCVPDMFQAIQGYYGIPFCGDHYCDGGEDCSSCPQDCGYCSDPCAGITECSNYTDFVNCTNDPCNVSGNCQWNGTDCAEPAAASFDGWRVLPITSEEEYLLGRIGGEGEQAAHGMTRSLSNPDIIYWSQDVAGAWKSVDGGESWKKTLGKGFYVKGGWAIEVDPVDPDVVFTVGSALWSDPEDFDGLYRSKDGGENWELVLNTDVGISQANNQQHRMYTHTIDYDNASITASGASVWYVAFIENGLYKSNDYGDTWNKVADLTGHQIIYGIYVHPTDGNVYIASSEGLYIYSETTGLLQTLGNLPAGAVTSIAVNPQNPDLVYATVKKDGLYKSLDRGNTFNLLKDFDVWRVFMNPGYPDTLYLAGYSSEIWQKSPTIITHDGGLNWIEYVNVTPAPGLGRDKWIVKIGGGVRAEKTIVTPNPNDPNEAVARSNDCFYKTTDGGHSFVSSSSLFTGYAVWLNSGFVFDKFDPNRFAFFLCDVIMVMTKNAGDWFYKIKNTVEGGEVGDWYKQGFLASQGANQALAGTFKPVPDSESMVAVIGDYLTTNRGKLMYLEDESTGWELVSDINLIGAEHLDENRQFISDIYNYVNKNDKSWSEQINNNEYVRVTFEENFTPRNWMRTYVNISGGLEKIEVYAKDSDVLLTEFYQNWQNWYWSNRTLFGSNYNGNENTFDLKIVGNWTKFDGIFEDVRERVLYLSFHPDDTNIVYAGDRMSNDGGRTFKDVEFKNETDSFNFRESDPGIMGMCLSNPDIIYALIGWNQILRSDNRGEIWNLYAKQGKGSTVFATDPVNCDKIYSIDSAGDIAVYDGVEWISLGLLPLVEKPADMDISVKTIAIDPNNNSIVYASVGGSRTGGLGIGISNIWRSTDTGTTWQDISYNLPRKGSYPMAVNPNTGELFAGGAVGTWIFPPPYNSSNLIYNKAYPMPSCYDGLQNGDETGVDSGGSCA